MTLMILSCSVGAHITDLEISHVIWRYIMDFGDKLNNDDVKFSMISKSNVNDMRIAGGRGGRCTSRSPGRRIGSWVAVCKPPSVPYARKGGRCHCPSKPSCCLSSSRGFVQLLA
eukprot:2593522-Pleurochrysis_carterae.AAC.3